MKPLQILQQLYAGNHLSDAELEEARILVNMLKRELDNRTKTKEVTK